MDYNRIGGHVGKLSVGGYRLNLDSADMASIANAASSFAKFIMKGAPIVGVGVGIAFLAALLGSVGEKEYPSMPLSGLVVFRNLRRQFVGVILNDSLHFESDDQVFEVPFDSILQLESHVDFSGKTLEIIRHAVPGQTYTKYDGKITSLSGMWCDYNLGIERSPNVWEKFRLGIKLVDYSSYYPIAVKDESIEFLSIAGKQSVKMNLNQPFYIHGVTVKDIETLKERLQFALESTKSRAIELLGEDIYTHYFSHE